MKRMPCKVKREVAKAKPKASDEVYERWTLRKKNTICIVHKDEAEKDVQQVWVIKGRDGNVLRRCEELIYIKKKVGKKSGDKQCERLVKN